MLFEYPKYFISNLFSFLMALVFLAVSVNTSAFANSANSISNISGASRLLGDTQNISSDRSALVNKNNSSASVILPLSLQRRTSLSHQNQIDVSIVKLRNNYEFIFFYSGDCPHCMSFDPVLKSYSDNSGTAVKAFVLGERLSSSFPNSVPVAQEVVDQFFGRGAKISVPTLFILNKNSLHAYPVSSGSLTYLELNARMNQLVPRILQNERYGRNEGIRTSI